eukprot:15066772-Alexandrium_andersonii.AAC.1
MCIRDRATTGWRSDCPPCARRVGSLAAVRRVPVRVCRLGGLRSRDCRAVSERCFGLHAARPAARCVRVR